MSIVVQKYGGTSVGSLEKIKKLTNNILFFKEQGKQIVVTVSAMSGQTNHLFSMAQEILDLSPEQFPQENTLLREVDALLATGEMVSSSLLSMHLNNAGVPAISLNAFQAGIKTSNTFSQSRIQEINSARIKRYLNENKVVIVAGFQGTDDENNITTLGRGGSDTTAVALAAALNAEECQIFTDVKGVYTADPRMVINAKKIDRLGFEEMLEMSSVGSKVLQIRSVELAFQYKIDIRVLSSFLNIKDSLRESSLITQDEDDMEKINIASVVSNKDEAKIKVFGVIDKPKQAFQIINLISKANIEIDMIVQNLSENNLTDLTFTVHRRDFQKALSILEAYQSDIGFSNVKGDPKIVKVSLVGQGMKSHAGIASKMFEVLGNENINIQMISTSEIKISVVIDEKYHELAVRSLHEAFIEAKEIRFDD